MFFVLSSNYRIHRETNFNSKLHFVLWWYSWIDVWFFRKLIMTKRYCYATIILKHYISVERHHSTHFHRCVSLWRGQNHLVFFDKDMEIFNALSYLSIAGKIDMSIEKTLCEWSGLGVLMLYIDKRFRIMRYYILPAHTTEQEENNVGRDKRGFGQ